LLEILSEKNNKRLKIIKSSFLCDIIPFFSFINFQNIKLATS
jgi:hypothetical protein